MSKRGVQLIEYGASDARLLLMAIQTLNKLAGGIVIALVVADATNDIFILPAPHEEAAILRVLARADWPLLARMAEEFTS